MSRRPLRSRLSAVALGVVVAVSVAGGGGAPGAAAAAAADPITAGTLLPLPPTRSGLGSVRLQVGMPRFVAHGSVSLDEYAEPTLDVRRLDDGSLVRQVPIGQSTGEVTLSGDVLVQSSADRTRATVTDTLTGSLVRTWDIPAGEGFWGAGGQYLLTMRGSEGSELVLRRPSQTDLVVTGVHNNSGGRPRVVDDRTVLVPGPGVALLDLVSGARTPIFDDDLPYAPLVVGPTRVFRITTELDEDVIRWQERDGTGSGTTRIPHVEARGPEWTAWKDGLAVAVATGETDPFTTRLHAVDLTAGSLGPVLADDVLDAQPLGDGGLVLALSDTPTGRVAVLDAAAPAAEAALRTVTQLPVTPLQGDSVGLSGSRLVVDTGDPHNDEAGPVLVASPTDGVWRDGFDSDGGLLPGSLVDLQGDILLTRLQDPGFNRHLYQVNWPGGSRRVESSIGLSLSRGGAVLQNYTDNGTVVSFQDPRTGAVLATADGTRPFAVDGDDLWRGGTAPGTLTRTDLRGSRPERIVDTGLGCAPAWVQVRGRWAMMACPEGHVRLVDLDGGPYGRDLGEGAFALGEGYIGRTMSIGDPATDMTGLEIQDIVSGQRRVYGPLHGRYRPPYPSWSPDSGTAQRLVYLDGSRQPRLVTLDWLSPAAPDVTPDVTAPVVSALTGSPALSSVRTLAFGWTASDPTGAAGAQVSGVAAADVHYRQAATTGGSFGAWQAPAAWQATTSTSVTLTAATGTVTCFQVRVRDHAGNVSAWTQERCSRVDAEAVTFGIRKQGAVLSWGMTWNFVHKGQPLTIWGAVRPAKANLVLRLQAAPVGTTSWTTVGYGTTDSAGNTKTTIIPTASRDYRWAWPGNATVRAGVSPTLRVTVVAPPAAYRNCTDLNLRYPHGVGKPNAADSTSGTPVRNFLPSTAAYALNDGGTNQQDLDRDNDGIACEKP